MRKKMLLWVLAATLLVSFVGISTGAAQEKEVRVGVIYPLTGPLAKTGLELRRIYLTLEEVINKKYPDWQIEMAATEGLPNLNGAKVKFIFGDHALSPEKGMAEAERLISIEKCVALCGTYNSSVAAAVSTLTERMKIPMVLVDTASPKLTERGLKWLFRTFAHDGLFVKVFFDSIKDVFEPLAGRKLTKVALMYEDSLWGQDGAMLARQYAKERGYNVVVDLPYRTGTTSLATEIQKLKSANPDWLASTMFISDALLFMRTCEEINYQVPMHLTHGAGFPEIEFIRMMGKKADGICSRGVMSDDLVKMKPDAGRFLNLYRKMHGYPPDAAISANYAGMFSGVYTLLYAINKAGSNDPQKIRDTLEKIMVPDKDIIVPTTGGGYHFNEKNQNIGVVPILMQLKDSKQYTIYPENIASIKPIYPLPKWSK